MGMAKSAPRGDLLAALRRLSGSSKTASTSITKPMTARSASTQAASDPEVKKMQMQLAKLGYQPGPADGVNRPATASAMGYFRQNYGVPASASQHGCEEKPSRYASPSVMQPTPKAKPMAMQAKKMAKPATNKADVKKMQVHLAKLGYEPGPANGVTQTGNSQCDGLFQAKLWGICLSFPTR